MWQLLEKMLIKTGKKSDVFISSYAFSETSGRMIARMKNEDYITHLFCLLDNRTDTRTPGSLQLLKGICTELKLIGTHAKITQIRSGETLITIAGSANYTENKRYEAGIITYNHKTFAFHNNWMLKEFADDTHTKSS